MCENGQAAVELHLKFRQQNNREQHSWLGVVERKHQVIRRALELYQDEVNKHDLSSLKEAAIYVPHAINQRLYTSAVGPWQVHDLRAWPDVRDLQSWTRTS